MPCGTTEPTIRLATTEDAPAIQRIYTPYVRETAISFERSPPSTDDLRERIEDTLERYPWLVCELGGTVAGYSYAGALRGRSAYQWSVESTVYVDPDHQRRGIACGLYRSLFAVLDRQGYCRVFAATALPNPASTGFHEAMGFTSIGVYENVGYKHDEWHDVEWWSRPLAGASSETDASADFDPSGDRISPVDPDPPTDPDPPLSIAEARKRSRWSAAVTAGQSHIRT